VAGYLAAEIFDELKRTTAALANKAHAATPLRSRVLRVPLAKTYQQSSKTVVLKSSLTIKETVSLHQWWLLQKKKDLLENLPRIKQQLTPQTPFMMSNVLLAESSPTKLFNRTKITYLIKLPIRMESLTYLWKSKEK
jgi:hypothetical protein